MRHDTAAEAEARSTRPAHFARTRPGMACIIYAAGCRPDRPFQLAVSTALSASGKRPRARNVCPDAVCADAGRRIFAPVSRARFRRDCGRWNREKRGSACFKRALSHVAGSAVQGV